MADRRTELDGRDEQNTTIPSKEPQNNEEGRGFWLRLFLLSAFLLLFARKVEFGFGRAFEGKYTRGIAHFCSLIGLIFGDLFIHT